MSEYLLKITDLSKSFGGVKALKGVNLAVNYGEIHCLAGENGCGKSTLIKAIAGAHAPDSGEIMIHGKSYSALTPIDAINEGIQIIYQDFSVFPNMTVAENIALTSELAKDKKIINWKAMRSIAEKAMKKIEVNIDLDTKVEDLSVADKQLVAISRALVYDAKLIIMDEPTTALTKKEVRALFKVIKGLQKDGISILFVSHKLEEVFELAEKITIFRNGKNVIHGNVEEFDRAKFIYNMTGREIQETYYENEHKREECLLKVENLSKKGGFKNISFELHAGEILGITGLLGSGRTELALSLFGVQPADSGNIYVNGTVTKIDSVQKAIKNGIAYVPEDRLTEGLFLQQSIGRNIIVSTVEKLLNKYKLIDVKKEKEEIESWIQDLNIATPSADLPVQALSGGNQQRIVIAKWLADKPQILILNGPTVGVDIGSKSEIHKILRGLAEKGVGVIIISDDISEVLQNCSQILIMRKGQIIGQCSNKEITEGELSSKLSEI